MKQDNDCNDIVQIIAGIISFILFSLWTFSLPYKIPGNTARTRDETQPYAYGRIATLERRKQEQTPTTPGGRQHQYTPDFICTNNRVTYASRRLTVRKGHDEMAD